MFTTRTGITGYCTPYDAKGVTYLRGGRIRLTAGKTWSAGLFGPWIGKPCSVVIETTGAWHKLHPLAVFAAWTYNDADQNELDLVEATRWGKEIDGDRNNPMLYYLRAFRGAVEVSRTEHVARAYDRHRIECDFGADGYAAVRIYGWWKGSEWKQVAWYHGPWWPGQLRIALWTFPGIRSALGECTVTVDKVEVTMADAEVAG